MKLTSEQVERTLMQFEAHAVPNNHPVVPQLSEMFGDHTFFLDSNGLNILEPIEAGPEAGVQPAQVVNLANWSDATLTKLAPHEPEPTDAVVDLGLRRCRLQALIECCCRDERRAWRGYFGSAPPARIASPHFPELAFHEAAR